MQKSDIAITKARIESFFTGLFDDGRVPHVTATIALYGANDKQITTFQITTVSYGTNKFDLPVELIDPIVAISKRLEEIATACCQRTMKALPPIEGEKA